MMAVVVMAGGVQKAAVEGGEMARQTQRRERVGETTKSDHVTVH